ncbi:myb-like protein X [Belonocnema kinseyi]|uniref:myb-like protein X n=1 Tax=Belonocnema kinseyi TaxID=2817044 RepID=UPI00143D728D|nr:myb-like protein X [Belonocnema kinseyi]XP_033228555.1 myb-like protein X [Belonocnema kinseyi]XP_033228557.1 myb-like protein X [Belonocnema kinseyi]XP_033228558.1 myb-like protein X [Belonocnema kinseyi]
MDISATDDEDVSFHLGEMFDSYEDLEQKLERFSKQSLVHYWRRDSRTVNGAHMKTARPISARLKYYSVKYACIYGGQKFLPRGAGRRQSQSIRTNCPAHIMLRASKDGTKLEVTSVNNEHNHEISEELFKNLPQERKLCGEIRQEVQDLMQLHIDRKRLKEYVRLRTNKILRSKDLFNIAAANKHKKEITPERAYQLFKKIHDIEKMQSKESGRKIFLESEEDMVQTIKRMKSEHEAASWVQDNLSTELDASEGNDGDDSYGDPLMQEESVDEMSNAEGQLVSVRRSSDLISVNGEIVGELVMEDGDPSVIVESIVNADESVFVDEREFNTYHLASSVRDSQSPTQEVLSPIMPSDEGKIKEGNSSRPLEKVMSIHSSPERKSPIPNEESGKIWLMKEEGKIDSEVDSNAESETNRVKSRENKAENDNQDIVISEDEGHQLLNEQLAVLKAEQEKLFHETEMLKLKKEKLRLEIKLLQSKVMEESNDVSHYIFVP